MGVAAMRAHSPFGHDDFGNAIACQIATNIDDQRSAVFGTVHGIDSPVGFVHFLARFIIHDDKRFIRCGHVGRFYILNLEVAARNAWFPVVFQGIRDIHETRR